MSQAGIGFMMLWLLAGPAVAIGSDMSPAHGEVEMIVWEHQNWESGGGYRRLTLWRDGRSEVDVALQVRFPDGRTNPRPRPGWTVAREGQHVVFVRAKIYTPETARAKLRQALEAGIQRLEAFRPGYHDGGGTRVVVQTNGRQKETVIPMFMDGDKAGANYERFMAVSKTLDGFDTNAYEVPDH